jgi:nicotinamidase-related amidase
VSEFRPALVVVDVQNGFVTKDSAHVVPVIAGLVRRWQDARGHVVFTCYRNYPGSPFERLIGWRGLHQSPDTDLVDELVPFTGQPGVGMISKTVYTALTSAGAELLRENGYTDLFICGIATDGCVLKTALDAFESGFTPWVIRDAVASNASSADPVEVHRAGLMLLSRLIGAGQLISTNEALARMLARMELYSEALIHHKKAESIAEEIGQSYEQAVAHHGIADTHRGSGHYDEALDHYDSALRLAREIGNPYQQARILDGIAETMISMGKREAARLHWRQALDLFQQLGVPEAEAVRIRLHPLGGGAS